jgi:hypothetical protein
VKGKDTKVTHEQRRTSTQVLESQRTVIQGDLNKGEEGLSSRDQVQRKKVRVVQQGEENQQSEIDR